MKTQGYITKSVGEVPGKCVQTGDSSFKYSCRERERERGIIGIGLYVIQLRKRRKYCMIKGLKSFPLVFFFFSENFTRL